MMDYPSVACRRLRRHDLHRLRALAHELAAAEFETYRLILVDLAEARGIDAALVWRPDAQWFALRSSLEEEEVEALSRGRSIAE